MVVNLKRIIKKKGYVMNKLLCLALLSLMGIGMMHAECVVASSASQINDLIEKGYVLSNLASCDMQHCCNTNTACLCKE